jgi:glycosyltransferase involved in cell wall biosynthesis
LGSASVSFIVPALNEQDNIEPTIQAIQRSLNGSGLDYQILIFDDASTDITGTLADRLAEKDPRIRVIHNEMTRGLGFNYFRGVELAEKEYVMMIPGDNEIQKEAIRIILAETGKADMIVPYLVNSEAKPFVRHLVSRGFVQFLNLLFQLSLKYYNGPCLLKTEMVRRVTLRTEGFAYMAVILVVLKRAGHSHFEVGIPLEYRQHGRSKAVHWKSINSVIKTIYRLTLHVYLS